MTMGATTALRSELKRRLMPLAQEKGFLVDQRNMPVSMEFRRSADGQMHIFGIQWEKYGRPRFVVQFGSCPAAGLRVNGNLFPAQDVLPGWLVPGFGRLQPRRGATSRAWFRQDRPALLRLLGRPRLRPPAEVVDEVLAAFPQLERYWSTGEAGPHMWVWPRF